MKNIFAALFMSFVSVLSVGQTWSPVGNGVDRTTGFPDPKVFELVNYNGQIYAGGSFDIAGSVLANNIAVWDGTDWDAVGDGLNNSVENLLVYNGEVYATGNFSASGSTAVRQIAKWNGSAWSNVGTGISGGNIGAIIIYNNELYAGGNFDSAGGVFCNGFAKWNGTTWNSVATWTGSRFITCMAIHNNALYIGGQYFLRKWDGVTLSDVDLENPGTVLSVITSLTSFGNSLYVGGQFDSIGNISANNIARWDGTNWFPLSTGTSHQGGESVDILKVFNNELYAGGFFSEMGGQTVNNIAKWNGVVWNALADGVNAVVNSMINYNGSFYVGGGFTIAGMTSVNRIAKLSFPVSVDENPVHTVEVFPNPSSGILAVQGELNVRHWKLYTMQGSLVKENSEDNTIRQIDLTDTPEGIYYLDLILENRNFHKKIILSGPEN